MKKTIALLLLAAMLWSLLIGCENRPEPTHPTIPETTPTTNPITEPTNSTTAPTEPEGAACAGHDSDPYTDVTPEEFYANYTPACCYEDAMYRTKHYFLSGSMEVPGQFVVEAQNQPMSGEQYIRNTTTTYLDDGNTYVVYDSQGKPVMHLYKGAAYITLEEVAAYLYAFGGADVVLPANYSANKKTKPKDSPWGIHLRVNHSKFSGNTSKYPYEPVMPDISGCGGSLQYYELDIGTTGTVTPDTRYEPALYNNGSYIERGAARIVYTRHDKNRNGIFEQDEVYVFYTHNHYNDFREYLNYYGGWGKMFGNITGGGTYNSKTDCNPTPYPETLYEEFVK